MASSNKKSSTSHDVSTDSDDTDCAKDRSDSPTNENSSSSKHRGYLQKKTNKNYIRFFSIRIKRVNNKMKPCLVNKTSTSDEELQLNETTQLISSSTNTGPTHGILKVPSGKNPFFL
jgi:hypothetical protein